MKILILSMMLILLSGCMTPDSIKLEADSNPQAGWEVDEVTLGGVWKIK